MFTIIVITIMITIIVITIMITIIVLLLLLLLRVRWVRYFIPSHTQIAVRQNEFKKPDAPSNARILDHDPTFDLDEVETTLLSFSSSPTVFFSLFSFLFVSFSLLQVQYALTTVATTFFHSTLSCALRRIAS